MRTLIVFLAGMLAQAGDTTEERAHALTVVTKQLHEQLDQYPLAELTAQHNIAAAIEGSKMDEVGAERLEAAEQQIAAEQKAPQRPTAAEIVEVVGKAIQAQHADVLFQRDGVVVRLIRQPNGAVLFMPATPKWVHEQINQAKQTIKIGRTVRIDHAVEWLRKFLPECPPNPPQNQPSLPPTNEGPRLSQ